jgi:hypothetical protein
LRLQNAPDLKVRPTKKMPNTNTKLEEIKKLYLGTTADTIRRDIARAIDILKSMPTEEERERASVYMEGLAEMRAEWNRPRPGPPRGRKPRRG